MRMTTILLLFFGILISVHSQSVIPQVNDAIKNANSKELAKYFHNSVELTLPGKDGIVSKAQAQLMVQEFFSANSVLSFSQKHQSTSKDGSTYVIGELKCKTNKFRTYTLFKNMGGEDKIQTFRIEQDF